MILLIDNYDSFSYNLYQLIGEIEPDIRVIRNDEMTVEEIRALKPDRIILSPGPGRPEDAGVIIAVAKELGKEIPILGVCLGHQAICAAYGATVTYAKELIRPVKHIAAIKQAALISNAACKYSSAITILLSQFSKIVPIKIAYLR